MTSLFYYVTVLPADSAGGCFEIGLHLILRFDDHYYFNYAI